MNESYGLPCKKYGINWANSVVCHEKMNDNLQFVRPKENRNNMKMRISVCGGVWNQICLRCGGRDNPAGAAALQNGAFPAKMTLPRPVGGSWECSVCADGQFVKGQNPSRVHGASLYIRRGGRAA